MPSLEQNPASKKFHIRFRFGGREFKRSLKTTDRKEALAAEARVTETLSLIARGVLEIPPDGDVPTFLLSHGRSSQKPELSTPMTLRELFDTYQKSLPAHAREESSLETEEIHLRHFHKHLPLNSSLDLVTTSVIQKYVNKQLKRKIRGRPLSPETVKRQMDTLRGIFNWAIKQDLYDGPVPTVGLVLPKRDEFPPFRTRAEIETIIARGGLTEHEIDDLWNSLYLGIGEVHEVLEFVKTTARYPFLHPMFCFVAMTGARRSEMMRARIDDFDLHAGTILIRERKRVRTKSTTYRRVQMPSSLVHVVADWFGSHPGGQYAFCHDFGIVKHPGMPPLTRDQARTQFKKTLENSKWDVIRGFHVFRHSYASNLAAAEVDQRIIDTHMGHQTEEMRRRYQHLRPSVCKQAVEVLS